MIFLERFLFVPWETEFTKMNSKINSETFLNEKGFPNFVISVRLRKIEKLLLISFHFIPYL